MRARRRRGFPGGCSAGRCAGRRSISPAPSDRAASSISVSSSSSTGCTVRTTNGSVTNSSASMIGGARARDVDPDRRARPVERDQRQPATIVGSANGRSMIALTTFLPRKSSRTSTQAMIVPVTALIPATISAATRLSSSAETACESETTLQKLDAAVRPRLPDDGGDRQHDDGRQKGGDKAEREGGLRPLARNPDCAATEAVLASRASNGLLDPDHQPALWIEPALVDFPPAAEPWGRRSWSDRVSGNFDRYFFATDFSTGR